MAWPDPQEVAVLTIDGVDYRNWETVQVTHTRYTSPYIWAKFTCAEDIPPPKNYAAMRIIPGQLCTITLGGQLALTGQVSTRQVFFDDKRHYVEIQATSKVEPFASSSIVHKTNEYKKTTAKKHIDEIIAPIGLKLMVLGGHLPENIFSRISHAPGTTMQDGTEMVLRQLGNYPLSSTPEGDLAVEAATGSAGQDTVYEGDLGRPKILAGREVIRNMGIANGLWTMTQTEATNTTWGTKAGHEPFHDGTFTGLLDSPFSFGWAPLVTALELPQLNPKAFLAGRARAEQELQTVDLITVIVTMRGWMRPSGGLWSLWQKVQVISPMLVMDTSIPALIVKSIVFSQDNRGGTTTTLELCNERALGAPYIG